MRLRLWWRLGLALLLASGPALVADPPYYARQGTWQETLLKAREAQTRAEEEAARQPQAQGNPRDPQLGTWYAVGPFPKKGASAFTDVFPPEQEIDLGRSYGGGKLRWARHPEWVDGTVHLIDAPGDLAIYLTRTITVPAAATINGYFGSDDGLVVWLNGEKILSNNVPRGPAPNQDTAPLKLAAGENRLLLKIHNQSGGCGFYFSTKPQPGGPDARATARDSLWALVERDFNDPASRRQIAWERQEGIWSEDWKPGDFSALAKRYAEATRVAFLRAEAQKLAPGVKDAAGLRQMAALFQRSRSVEEANAGMRSFSAASLRLAIEDLRRTFGKRYPKSAEYLRRLETLEKARTEALAGDSGSAGGVERLAKVNEDLNALRREALLANPLLGFDRLLFVKRGEGRLGLPQNWQGNSSVPRDGYDNEIDLLSLSDGKVAPLFRPEGGRFVGDLELHWNADRLLFSMPDGKKLWQIFEIGADGKNPRQVTPGDQPDVDNFDACYLPNGKVVFCSTACFQGVPCVGGSDHVALLYELDPQTAKIRQLTFDQDHSWCPTVLNDGRLLYTRWEYSDLPHYFSRLLFRMNPDGTEQSEYYGSNSYWPNSTFYARPIPNEPTKVVAVVSGHHGSPRMGELIVFDPGRGRQEGQGVVQRIPGYGKPVEPIVRDTLVDGSWPKFLHPYPLSDKYFLVSCKPSPTEPWGLYLVDIYDNLLLLKEEPGYALFEPTPLQKRPVPPVIPEKVKPGARDAVVYLENIYAGEAMRGVPRGTVKKLRVYSDHYAYVGMGGHINIGIDGPWDVKRILGTVPVNEDGSATFRVPANTPIAVEPVDAEGRAVQVMRSWFTAMPGESLSCVGCHESTNSTPTVRGNRAAQRTPVEIAPWYGPARGFSFEREVQPVLDKYCLSCHNGIARPDGQTLPDLRAKKDRPDYGGAFTPAYEVLHRFVRRPGPESNYQVLMAGEYLADTSELIQMLKKGHYNVRLDGEAWDRLYTWIDLNVPCHGTWHEHRPIPGNYHQRREELRRLYAGLNDDYEAIPALDRPAVKAVLPEPLPPRRAAPPAVAGWPLPAAEAMRVQASSGPATRKIDLGDGVTLELARIPAGEFVMGDAQGAPDEQPPTRVRVDKPFWMGRFEVTNAQYHLFDPAHDSGFASYLNKDHSSRGYPLNEARQPVVRVSWERAQAFCRWLSQKTGERFALPTETQWEYACRAGTATPLFYGDTGSDFSRFANVADATLSRYQRANSPDWMPKDSRFSDNGLVTMPVGSYQPNPWGLFDMVGNAAEWTRSPYAPYPSRADAGAGAPDAPQVVRGGSWYDRPARCRSSFRLGYPAWRGVYNVGFRVVCEPGTATLTAGK